MNDPIYQNEHYLVRVHAEQTGYWVRQYENGPRMTSWYEVVNKATSVVEGTFFTLPEAMGQADALSMNLVEKPWVAMLAAMKAHGLPSSEDTALPPIFAN